MSAGSKHACTIYHTPVMQSHQTHQAHWVVVLISLIATQSPCGLLCSYSVSLCFPRRKAPDVNASQHTSSPRLLVLANQQRPPATAVDDLAVFSANKYTAQVSQQAPIRTAEAPWQYEHADTYSQPYSPS